MPRCPVCQEEQNADEAAFAHHVNGHFEGGSSSGSGGGNAGRMDGRGGIGASHLVGNGTLRRQESPQDDLECPFCGYPLGAVSARDRDLHVNSCMETHDTSMQSRQSSDFDSPEDPYDHYNTHTNGDFRLQPPTSSRNNTSRPQLKGAMNGNTTGGDTTEWDGPAKPGDWQAWIHRKQEKGDGWWDSTIIPGSTPGWTRDLPQNFSPGLISVLEKLLLASRKNGVTKRAVLCRDTVHIRGVWTFDMSWGCGYRNALMAISSLILYNPNYRHIFSKDSNGADPGVRRIQGWIQEAWAAGFDLEGKEQLKGKVLGTRTWIGTSDLLAMFSYLGVPCELVDFPKPKDSKNGKPAHQALQEWVKTYFDNSIPPQPNRTHGQQRPVSVQDALMRPQENNSPERSVYRSNRYPLILQHAGHSRSIVGYEETNKGDIHLLLFDPGKRGIPNDLRDAGINCVQTDISRPSLLGRTSSSSHKSGSPVTKHKSSHESIPFNIPYTNGASELVHLPESDDDEEIRDGDGEGDGHHQRISGGSTALGEDEEMDEDGWVRRKLKKSKIGTIRTKPSNGGVNKMSGPSSGDGTRPWEGSGVAKSLGYFRVKLSSLGYHTEYQILAFTGGPVLSPNEKERRKIVSSTIVT